MSMHRLSDKQLAVNVTTSATNSGIIPYRGWSGAMVFVPAGSAITSLTWYASTSDDGTFRPVQDGSGSAVTTTISAGNCCLAPAALFAAGSLMAVANAAGTIDVSLKA